MSVSANQVQKIIRLSVWARNITACLIALLIVGVGVAAMFILFGIAGGTEKLTVSVGPYTFPAAALKPWSARLYVVVMLLIGGALALTSLFLIRAVFADLARGNIFCDANVRRIRNLGWLTIAVGAFYWLMPLANAAYFMVAGHADITYRDEPTLFTGLGEIINGALLLLLSWIMAVGLGVREDAEELRRDAELVI